MTKGTVSQKWLGTSALYDLTKSAKNVCPRNGVYNYYWILDFVCICIFFFCLARSHVSSPFDLYHEK